MLLGSQGQKDMFRKLKDVFGFNYFRFKQVIASRHCWDTTISCALLRSSMDTVEVESIYSNLASTEPTIKLLYVTPEMIGASIRLNGAFMSLFRRNLLARFVVSGRRQRNTS
uniref:DUF4817 domain-containing protein n=1 Tax=Globodera pallida TaxID=36090 RepID=A0A183C1I8_GLOPA